MKTPKFILKNHNPEKWIFKNVDDGNGNALINEVSLSAKGMIDNVTIIQLTGELTVNAKDLVTTLRKETAQRKRVI